MKASKKAISKNGRISNHDQHHPSESIITRTKVRKITIENHDNHNEKKEEKITTRAKERKYHKRI